MATQLHAAEEARHRAERRLAEVEAAAARQVAKVEAELALTREAFAGAQAQAEEVRAAYRRAMGGAEPEWSRSSVGRLGRRATGIMIALERYPGFRTEPASANPRAWADHIAARRQSRR